MDVTKSQCAGRIINDEHKKLNCKVKLEEMEGNDVQAVYTIRDITKGSELRLDYEDKEASWRKVSVNCVSVEHMADTRL